jgi:hypothetical protein
VSSSDQKFREGGKAKGQEMAWAVYGTSEKGASVDSSGNLMRHAGCLEVQINCIHYAHCKLYTTRLN